MNSVIDRVELFPVRLPMIRGFSFASGTAGEKGDTAPHVFVKVTDSDGAIGWGEARPVPGWSYETPETVISTVAGYLAPIVLGVSPFDRRGIAAAMGRAIGRAPSTGQPIAQSALGCAIDDLCARRVGLPLRAFLGGSPKPAVLELSYTLTPHDPAKIRDEMQEAIAGGFLHFNFKAAVAPRTDRAVAETIRREIPAGGFVWADANQGFSLDEARSAAAIFAAIGVDLLEQPLPADQLHLMRSLRSSTALPLAIDEASVGAPDFFAYARENLVDYLVMKLTRSGGVLPTLDQVSVARAAGLRMVVSGLTDGLVTKLTAAHVAAAAGVTGPLALNGSQFVDESDIFPQKSAVEGMGRLTLGERAGIGIEPDEGALRERASESYQEIHQGETQ